MAIVKLNLSGHYNDQLDKMGFDFPGALHIDLNDKDWCQKVAQFLAPMVNSGDIVHVALPGLSPLTAIVLATLHGLTGQFASMQPLVRGNDGQFIPIDMIDVQAFRNDVARGSFRKDVVVL